MKQLGHIVLALLVVILLAMIVLGFVYGSLDPDSRRSPGWYLLQAAGFVRAHWLMLSVGLVAVGLLGAVLAVAGRRS